MPKVLYVATVVKTHIMEFHIPYLKMLKEMGWETAVAARNDFDEPTDCVIPYCDIYYDIPFERNPFKLGNIRAYKELKKVIDEGNYDIVHCHTPVGAMLTRLAAQDARKKGSKVFYTAHGFHFYKGAPLINWLLFYPGERLLARKTDVLITINKEDYKRAQTFKAGKVVYVPGVGIDINKFSKRIGNRDEKRAELGFNSDDFVLLSVGELISRKNHSVVLDALGKLKKAGKLGNTKYVICGRGVLDAELKAKAKDLGIADHVHFLGYRNDVSEICNAADLFMFMSLQEGLPVALMEAMASGLPVVCSDIRGNTDLIKSGKNGEIVENTAVACANPPQKTAIIYKEAANLRRIEQIRFFSSRFDVQKRIENPDDIDTIVRKIDKSKVVFIAGIDISLRDKIINFCLEEGIQCFIAPQIGDVVMAGAEHMQNFNIPIMRVHSASPTLEYLIVKRAFDVVGALLGVIMSSPLMLITAIAIKAYDGGPILYRQVRLTQGRREFSILKFRSMCVDAEKDGIARLAGAHDDRITPVGKIIRTTRLDELPQLFNILRGDMTIVGPRPERPEIAEQYEEVTPAFALRLQVKAGLTGYAQVYGKYNTEPEDKLQMDLMYINNMSIVEDMRLIFATIKVLFLRDSTSGVREGQITASVAEKTEKSA